MIDIELLRKNPDAVRANLARRHCETHIEKLISIDVKWRQDMATLDLLRNRRNVASGEIADLKKEKKDAAPIIAEMKDISGKIAHLQKETARLDEERNGLLGEIPNLLDPSVPEGKDGAQNVVLRSWGDAKSHSFPAKSHSDILEQSDFADMERAARATGARFYYLKGDLLRMARALEDYALDHLTTKKFLPMQTPFMLRKEAIRGAVPLSDFEDVIFKVENEDLHLIGTSEHSLLAYHMGEIFEVGTLPKLYCGVSTNFRKEAGAHGKDMKGIFRVRQFDKVEQFVFCRPEESQQFHEALIANAEEIFRALEIPHRVVVLCGGDTGKVPAKTYDLEAWMPVQGEYRELCSISNCTDYQARRLGIRYRLNDGTALVHTLNGTAVAVQRTLAAIIENFQTPEGKVSVPKVLRPYMKGKEIIG